MESFFSLFDPSEGGGGGGGAPLRQNNKKRHKPQELDAAKKKTDSAPKGRRRGRRCVGKSETLPEESSFLCEPDLSTELLVKHGSYIESFIELNNHEEDAKTDPADKRPKRRNSGRKSRRKKNKVSPSNDPTPTTAWFDESEDTTSWNNQSSKPKVCDENIGKNVNDLKSDDYKNSKRKNSSDGFGADKVGSVEESAVYNVIDKLEKVGLKDDTYLAGDFNTEELENDFLYSSDDLEESYDDTSTSSRSDSGEDAHGSLPPEPRFGNVEYKLQLVAPCERRFQHLVTQLKWRLRSGGGSAVYVLGVRDCGALRGLRARGLRASLHTVRRMALAIQATLTHVTARRVAPHRAVAEVYIRKVADAAQSVELRVAVTGANEAGKSTLIGVLTQGELDNGRGSARLNMFRHLHEVRSGRTSSLSHEILGFDKQGNVVNYGCSELMTAERIGERSAKLVSFLDLAGHSKYQRTTLHGLTGYSPHYAMLVISATAGITRITEEHIGLLLALDLPFFAVITKCELAPPAVQPLVARLGAMLAPAGKKPLLIPDEHAARGCVAPHRLILDTIDGPPPPCDSQDDNEGPQVEEQEELVPVFPVSCVRGAGLSALHAYLLALQPPAPAATGAPGAQHMPEDETCEFQIDEIFNVGDSGGPVVGGLLCRGRLRERDTVIIGPLDTGEFAEITVRSIYRNRVPHGSVRAGQSASLGLGPAPPLRPGMVLLAVPGGGGGGQRPTFGGCQPGRCRRRDEVAELIQNRQHTHENAKNRKNVRRKNKNLLQDLAKVEHSLVKVDNIEGNNIYRSDSDGEKGKVDIGLKGIAIGLKGVDIGLNNVDIGLKNVDIGLNNVDIGLKNVDIGLNNVDIGLKNVDIGLKGVNIETEEKDCVCRDEVLLEDPNDPRGCIYFQATVHVLRHATTIYPGFQCTVHVGNVRQTAIIEGILSHNNELRAGEAASVLFRFARCPEYLVRGRQMLFTAGLGTRAIGRITQIFPYVP